MNMNAVNIIVGTLVVLVKEALRR